MAVLSPSSRRCRLALIALVAASSPIAAAAPGAQTAPGPVAAGAVAAASAPADEPAGSESRAQFGARVRGARLQGERAVSDLQLTVGELRLVPRRTAAELLTLAPGILLTNHGGEGHAQRVFLRGFDAREGQDLEFTVGGVPVNEVATAHGQGYADTHFIIPETVESLRVIEGPFDPRQGDFAVAGSADYQLAVSERGLRASYRGGSWNSHRLLLLWAPDASLRHGLGEDGTFGAVELAQSDGYGPNRFSQRAAATAQWELRLGESGRLRLLAMTYATRFQSPGVLRQDDYQSGRKDFFDTYDTGQGGDAQRHTISAAASARVGRTQLMQQAFVIVRELRLRENLTGFLLDPQRLGQAPRGEDPQRGDLLDQHTSELTVGARGSVRIEGEVLGQLQRIEAGYYARHDRTEAEQLRLRRPELAGTTVTPYRTDFRFGAGQTNIAGYLDAELRLTRFVTLRGGVRGDFFLFDVQNRCAQMNVVMPGAPLDQECYSLDRYGYRSPTERKSATGLVVQPRLALQVQPVRGLTLAGSYGHGARSADPLYLADGDDAPFAQIRAAEGGVLYSGTLGPVALSSRAAFFYTHVDKDLIFNQTVGRNTLAGGTTRLGVLGAVRATAPFADAALHVTWARATFDEDGLLVPYVPDLVVRGDVAAHGALPRLSVGGGPLIGSVGVGLTYVAPRALPLSERGDAYVLLDLSAQLRLRGVAVGLSAENLLNRRYRLSEFNYASDFRSRAYPTQVAERHFVAGPPLGLFATVTVYLDEALRALSALRPRRAG